MEGMKRVTLLVPCYNEEKSIPLFYDVVIEVINGISNYKWEILFIDDGSKDKTIDIIKTLINKDPRVKFISLSRNFGKEIAMKAGIDLVKSDAVIIMDADLQNPPTLIPEMLYNWENGFDDVFARKNSRGKESWIRKKLSLQYYNLLQKSTKMEIYPNVGDFRLLDWKCLEALKNLKEKVRYTKGLFSYIGFNKIGIDYDVAERNEGKSKWSFFKLFELAVDGLTSFSVLPLRISSIMGIIVSLFAFGYMIFIFFRTLIYGDLVRGFPTLIIIILFLGGIQLISIGIIGEYISRIYTESKERPSYFINETNYNLNE